MSEAPTPLAATAFWTAAIRAQETERPDRLFADPWASVLAGVVGTEWLKDRSPDSLIPIVLRTRYFDDYLRRIVAAGIRQVVLLGAGLDTRAFRLDWPSGTTLYEVDTPALLDYKAAVLRDEGARPRCARADVRADLTGEWISPLRLSGHRADLPSGWLLEGFLFYLSSQAIEALLEQVTGVTAAGSWLGFDVVNSEMLTSPLTRPWVEMQEAAGAPWLGVLDDPAGFLARRGWKVELTQAGQPEAHHGRWKLPVVPVNMPDIPHNWFVVAEMTSAGRASPHRRGAGGSYRRRPRHDMLSAVNGRSAFEEAPGS